MPKVDLPYAINDADNHFNEPPDLYERYIDPSQRDLAIRYVTEARRSQAPAVRGTAVEVRRQTRSRTRPRSWPRCSATPRRAVTTDDAGVGWRRRRACS